MLNILQVPAYERSIRVFQAWMRLYPDNVKHFSTKHEIWEIKAWLYAIVTKVQNDILYANKFMYALLNTYK